MTTFTIEFDLDSVHTQMLEEMGEQKVEKFLETQLHNNGQIEDIIHTQYLEHKED